MICLQTVKKFCCEDLSLIENYDKAISDTTQTWDCHHRLEIQEDKITPRKELISQGLYYNRPADELIFLTPEEHISLHASNRTEEANNRISEYMKNRKISDETKRRISNGVKKHQSENPITEEQHKKMSYMQQNMKFFNNGIVSTKALECPEGFVPGRLKYYTKGNTGMKWYNNGVKQIQCYPENCPEGFVLGKLPYSEEHNRNISKSRKQLMKNPEYIKKLSEANKGKKYYTNGIINVVLNENEPCPEGFWRGQTRNNKKQKPSENELF